MTGEELIAFGKIISKCWTDPDFKEHFRRYPAEVLKSFGISTGDGVTYNIIFAPKLVQYAVLPYDNPIEGVQQLSKLLLWKAERTQQLIPLCAELRIIQDTECIRHLVIPFDPSLLTESDLLCCGLEGGVVRVVVIAVAVAVSLAAAVTNLAVAHDAVAGTIAAAAIAIGVVLI